MEWIVNLFNNAAVMRGLAIFFFLHLVTVKIRTWGHRELRENYTELKMKLVLLKQKLQKTTLERDVYHSVVNEAEEIVQQWKKRSEWFEKRAEMLGKQLANSSPNQAVAKLEPIATAPGPPSNSTGQPVTVINNFTTGGEAQRGSIKEEKVKLPKNLDDVEESLRKGGRLMSKMRKQKSLVREVGFWRAVMMFGLTYALASMIKESWDRVKHRFDEDDKSEEGKKD